SCLISMNCYRALFVHCPVGKNVGWRLLKEFYMNLRCYFLMSRQQGLIHKIELIYGDILKNYETMADRKSTRLNSSHASISYFVYCFHLLCLFYYFPTRRSSDLFP